MEELLEEDYKFSVLMSIYYKENPTWFKIALDSVINQTLQPDEIVLVEDGQLSDELYQVIDEYKTKHPSLFNIVKLEKNSGLGEALRIGVENCSNEIIARMDTDDIARNDRFEKQILALKENSNVSIVGSFISEFEDDPNKIISYRNLPIESNDIFKFAKFRNPLNHMTVVFRKKDILDVGNYQPMLYMEDYYLWVRLLNKGYKAKNMAECLVNVRAGASMLQRRANLNYFFKSELPFNNKLLKIGFIDLKQYLKNVISKFALRAIPIWAMSLIYKKFLRETK